MARIRELRSTQSDSGFLEVDCLRFFEGAPSQRLRPPLLLCHGLNTRPSVMDPLAEALAAEGFPVLRMSFSGHHAGGLASRGSPLPAWREDLRNACGLLRLLSPLPPVLMAYSLGASLALAETPEPFPFAKAVLLAPALTPQPFISLLRFLSWMPDFVIPSASPPRIRARRGTPVREYLALQETAWNFWDKRWARAKDIPTLVFIDPADELVSLPALQRRLGGSGTHAWKVEEVLREASVPRDTPRHLILDPASLGERAFASLVAKAVSGLS